MLIKPSEGVYLPVAYLPTIEYMAIVLYAKRVMYDIHEYFPKQSYRNATFILTSQGVHRLSIPLARLNRSHMPIHALKIAEEAEWQKQHWRTLQTAYRSSPFFEYFEEELEDFFSKRYTSFLEVITDGMQWLYRVLDIKVDYEYSKEYHKPREETEVGMTDLRLHFRKHSTDIDCPAYTQVFSDKSGFIPNLSVLDLLFCVGPQQARTYLSSLISS